jgi:hypothetical protein
MNHIIPKPIGHDQKFIAETDQEHDVNQTPLKPSKQPAEMGFPSPKGHFQAAPLRSGSQTM